MVDLRRFAQKKARIYYLSANQEMGWNDREMEEVAQDYNPDNEVIVFLYFGEKSPKNDCYKIAAS